MARAALTLAWVLGAGLCGAAGAQEYQPNLAQIGVTPALHAGVDGSGVLVGILDGYADYAVNPDLVRPGNQVDPIYPGTYGYDLHATHVSGIVGAAVNGFGVVGVAPGASLLSLPVFDAKGWVATDLGKAALDAAVAGGASIVNMSYGPTRRGDVFLTGELPLFDDYLDSLLIVRAAGNSGANVLNEYYAGVASADLANLLIVGSVDANNKISSFSTRPGGACIATKSKCAASEKASNFFIVAPGRSIVSDAPGSATAALSGTSMAAPHVAGAAALVIADGIAKNVVLSPADVAGIIKRSARDLGTRGVDSVYGWGLLDVPAALSPVGQTFIATGPTVADGGTPVGKGRPRVSSAFARRGIERAFAGSVYFDAYGRPFDASGLVASADPAGSARSLAVLAAATGGSDAGFGDGFRFTDAGGATLGAGVTAFARTDDHTQIVLGFGEPRAYFDRAATPGPFAGGGRLAAGFLAGAGGATAAFDRAMFSAFDRVIDDRISISGVAFSGLGGDLDPVYGAVDWPAPAAGFAAAGITYRASERLSATAGIGLMAETGSVLGAAGDGPYGLAGSALTPVANFSLGYAIDGRRSVSFYADGGVTDPVGAAGALVDSIGLLTAVRFGIGFNVTDVRAAGDRLSLSFGRPFAVVSGQSTVTVATGRALDGTVSYETRVVDYAAGLPLEAGVAYQAGAGNLRYGLEARLVSDDATSAAPRLDGAINGAVRLAF